MKLGGVRWTDKPPVSAARVVSRGPVSWAGAGPRLPTMNPPEVFVTVTVVLAMVVTTLWSVRLQLPRGYILGMLTVLC